MAKRRAKRIKFTESDFYKMADDVYVGDCLDSYRRGDSKREVLNTGETITCLEYLLTLAGDVKRPQGIIASNMIYEFADIPYALDPVAPMFIEYHLNNIYPHAKIGGDGKPIPISPVNVERMRKFYENNHGAIPNLACRSDRYDYKKHGGTISCLEEIMDRDKMLAYPFGYDDAVSNVCHISSKVGTNRNMRAVTCGEKIIHQMKYSNNEKKVKYKLSDRINSKFAESAPYDYIRWLFSEIPRLRDGSMYIEQLKAYYPTKVNDTGDGNYTRGYNSSYAKLVEERIIKASIRASPESMRNLREWVTTPLKYDGSDSKSFILDTGLDGRDKITRALQLPVLIGVSVARLISYINNMGPSLVPDSPDYANAVAGIKNSIRDVGSDPRISAAGLLEWLVKVYRNENNRYDRGIQSAAGDTLRENRNWVDSITSYDVGDDIYFKLFGVKRSDVYKNSTIDDRKAADSTCIANGGDKSVINFIMDPAKNPYDLNPDPNDIIGVYDITLKESYAVSEIEKYSNSVNDLWKTIGPILNRIKTNVPCGDSRADVDVSAVLVPYSAKLDDLAIMINYVRSDGTTCGTTIYPFLRVLSDFPKSIKREMQRSDIASFNKLQSIINMRKQAPKEEADYKLVISNKRSDIFRVSACQHWDRSSCLRPVNTAGGPGFHRWALKSFADFGSYAAYLVTSNPYEPDWLSRALIHQCGSPDCLLLQPSSYYAKKPHHGQILRDAVMAIFKRQGINSKCSFDRCDPSSFAWVKKNAEVIPKLRAAGAKLTDRSIQYPTEDELAKYPELYDNWTDDKTISRISDTEMRDILQRRVSGRSSDFFVRKVQETF